MRSILTTPTVCLFQDSELVFTLGAIDLFDEDLPELKNANGTDLFTFDPRGRRVYGSVKFTL